MQLKHLILPILLTACGSDGLPIKKAEESKPALVEANYCHLLCIDAVNKMGSIIREQPIELLELSALTKECEDGLTAKEIKNDICKSGIQNLDAMTHEEFVSYCHSTNWLLTHCQ